MGVTKSSEFYQLADRNSAIAFVIASSKRLAIRIRPHSYLVLTTGRWHLHTCHDDLDLSRAAVDEEFDAVDET